MLFVTATHAQQKTMDQLIDENLQLAAQQYQLLARNTPDSLMPRNYDTNKGRVVPSNIRWWCSGFFPGTLWMIYEHTKDPAIRTEAEKRLRIISPNQYYTGDHDLGFMMYNSFGNAYRLTKDPAYKDIILTSANTLSKRFRPSISVLQSWDSSANFKCPVIIDNMMNLELLCWAAENGGAQRLKEIAIMHADTTIKNQYRPDYSAYHVLDYDLKNGGVSRKLTAQGYAAESAWARGQSWGLYGYTMMYRFTRNPAYLTHATRIAAFMLNHPRMPADGIPYWDFDAPDIPNAKRDASAGAILASALLELAEYVPQQKKTYRDMAEKILRTLSSPAYRSEPGANGGFLLMHSVGAIPYHSEVDVPLTYADYYFIEALLRWKRGL
jgi:hypothetical protein